MSSAKPTLLRTSSLSSGAAGVVRGVVRGCIIASTPLALPLSTSLANWMPLSIELFRLILELVSSCSLAILGLLASLLLKLALGLMSGGLGLDGLFKAPLLPLLLMEGTLA